MSISVPKAALLLLVQKAYSVAPPKSSLQILSNVRMTCKEGTIEVCATDLDQSIRCIGSAQGDAVFDLAVNARKLFDIVREMPEGDISIDQNEGVLSLASDRGFSCRIAGADVGDFPAFPDIGDAVSFEMSIPDLRRMVDKSSFAVSKDTTRSCLCGVLWEVDKERCGMVATDGHRLGRSYRSFVTGLTAKTTAIVSPKSLLHVAKVALGDDDDSRVRISIGEKYILFEAKGFVLCSKLLEGPYPDHEKVIPRKNPRSATTDRLGLIDAVRRVLVLSSQKTHLVKFHFNDASLEVTALNRDIGAEAREVVPATYDGGDLIIGFNGVYMSEILSTIDTPTVRLEMNTQISACLVFPTAEKDAKGLYEELFLIMPLRLMDEA